MKKENVSYGRIPKLISEGIYGFVQNRAMISPTGLTQRLLCSDATLIRNVGSVLGGAGRNESKSGLYI